MTTVASNTGNTTNTHTNTGATAISYTSSTIPNPTAISYTSSTTPTTPTAPTTPSTPVGNSCVPNAGKACSAIRYYFTDQGRYYSNEEAKSIVLSYRCPAQSGWKNTTATYKLDSTVYWNEARLLADTGKTSDGGTTIRANYIICRGESVGVTACDGYCDTSSPQAPSIPAPTTPTTPTTPSNPAPTTPTTPTTPSTTKNPVITNSSGQQTLAFATTDRMNVTLNGFDPNNTYACMDTTNNLTCNDGSAWVKLPNVDWTVTNNTLQARNFALGFLAPGSYRMMWREGANGQITTRTITIKEAFKAVTRDISYLPGLTLDVHLPATAANQKVQTFVMVHGGGWVGASKNDATVEPTSKFFIDNGAAFVNINYTLGAAGKPNARTIYQELDCALQWVQANAATYNFDTTKIGLIGGSSGGQTVLQYAMNQSAYRNTACSWNQPQASIKKVIAIASPTDLEKATVKTGLDANMLMSMFLGATPGTQEFVQKQKENSPINFIGRDNKNTKYYIFHAKDDGVVNYDAHAIPFYNAMKQAGYYVKFYDNFKGHSALTISPADYSDTIND